MQKTSKEFKMWPAVAVLVVALWCVSSASAACPSPSLAYSIRFDGMGAVYVATLDDEVFAVKSEESGADAVRVYDAATMTFKRSLPLPGLDEVGGLAADTRDKYLYVSSIFSDTVLKIEPANGNVVLQWNAGSMPTGVVVNSQHNLIVNLFGDFKIKEYTPEGTLVREAPVDPRFAMWDVAELPGGEFMFSSLDDGDNLVVVNQDGAEVKTDAGLLGTGAGFDIFGNGYAIVVDYDNNAVLIVNPSLTSAQQLQVPGLETLDEPMTVRIDEARDRAYIGEAAAGGRLWVLENVVGDCLAF